MFEQILTDKTHTTPCVLLVEDSEHDVFFFEYALKKTALACRFFHVGDGGAAIEFLQSSRESGNMPNLIFLDLKMPRMSGFEVLDWLRQQDFGKWMRVIVLSGSNQAADRARAEELGASDYLVKPVTVEAIREHIQGANAGYGAPVSNESLSRAGTGTPITFES
jgi:CheY-like chemotaxis protein